MRMAGVKYSTASYISHIVKGLPRDYNLMKRMMMVPGTRESLDKDSITSYILQDEAMQEAKQPTELLPQVNYAAPMKLNQQQGQRRNPGGGRSGGGRSTMDVDEKRSPRDKGRRGRGRSTSRRPRRDAKPRKEKQTSKKTLSTKDVDNSSSKSRGDGEASCLMVDVVEPTVSLASEADEDFQAVAAAKQANPMAVLLDSGCSHHLMGTKTMFVDMAPSDGVKHANLLFAGQLKESGVQLQGDGDEMLLVAATGEVLSRARYNGRVLCTDIRPCSMRSSPTEVVALRTIVSETKSTPVWLHARLAHVSVDTIKSSAKHEVATGLDITPSIGEDPPCVSCVGGKLAWHTFPDKGSDAEEALAVVHIDLCVPFRVAAKDGSLFFLLLKDRHTRFVWVMSVAKKSDVLQEFQKWLVLVERQAKKSVLMLRSDRGGEFLGKELTDFVNGKGIAHDLTCPYTPQQNGMAEREVRTAVESRSTTPPGTTPYQVLTWKKPDLMLAQVWGCMVQFMVPEQQRGGKLAPKARWGLHLGVSPESKGWEVLDLTNNKVVTSAEVIFYETLSLEVWKAKYGPASGRTQAHPPTDTSTATVPLLAEVDEPADEDVEEVLPPSPVLAPPFPVADRPALTPVSATGDEGSLEAAPVAPASGIASGRQGAKLVYQDGKTSTTGEQQTGEPVEQEAAGGVQSTMELPKSSGDPENRWDIATMTIKEAQASWKGEAVKAAMEEEIRSLVGMCTWELVKRPRGVNIMKNRWVLTTKYRLDDIVKHEKARLVVKGFTQVCSADYDETYSPSPPHHPTSCRVLSSQDVTFDESVSYYHPVKPVQVAVDSGAAKGAEPAGVGPGGAQPRVVESGGAEPERAESGGPSGVPSRQEPLSPQRLREWYARRCCRAAGATGPAARGAFGAGAAGGAAGAGAAGAAGPGGAGARGIGAVGGPAGVGAAGGAGAASPGGACTGGTGAVGAGGAAGVGAVGAGAVATGGAAGAGAAGGTGAGGAAGVVAGDPGAEGTGAVFAGGASGAGAARGAPSAGAAGAAGPRGAGAGGTGTVGGPTGFGAAGGAGATSPGGANTGGTGAAEAGGTTGVGAVGAGAIATGGAAGAGAARGTGAGGAVGVVAGDPGAEGTGAVSAVSRGAAQPWLYYVPLLQQVLGLPPSTGPTPPLQSPLPVQSQSQLQPASPLPGPSPYSGPTRGLTECREPESRPTSPESHPVSPESRPESPVCAVCTGRRVLCQRPPPIPGTHSMTLRPSIAPQRVPLPSPPASSLPAGPDLESDSLRAASPIVTHFLATAVNDPSFESTAASALVAELVDFAAACRLDYAASLVAESQSASVCPPSVGGQCALSTDVLEDRQEEFECFAAALPHLVSMLLAPKGDPDAPDIPTPRSYVPPPGANIVSGMWIFRVKRPPGSPPVFKALYVARGFSERQGVDFFQNFSSTPKMTTLWVLLHVAAQHDYELHSLDFSTAFLQGSLHAEIWLRRPPGFTGSFPAGTQWSLRRPVYGLRQAPREWHDTLRMTLAALGFAPSNADPSLFLRIDTTLPPFYILVYVDNLVFATADTEALAHVKSELQKRHTCTDVGELTSNLGLRITRDRAQHTITLNQSHRVQQVLQRFGFTYSSPQSTPLPTGHSLSAPPSDESVEPSGSYPSLVGCLIHRKEHMDAAKRALRYLCSMLGMGLVLGGRVRVVLTGHADTSWVDDLATQRLSQGYTFSLGSGSFSWRSTRSSSVLNSSCEGEIYSGAMAAQELRWLTYLLTDLGELPHSPPVLYHRGQLHLAYVATRANTADVFTKALPPCDHQRFCAVLGLGTRRCAAGRWLEEEPGRQGALLQDRRQRSNLLGAGLLDAYAELPFEDEEAQEREEEEYRQKVGSLQFVVTTTRPDIAFACSKLGSGLTVRSDQHWREVNHCLTYLADTRDIALEFGGGPESLELIGYVDGDDAGNKQKRTSTSGYMFVYGGAAVASSSSRIKCATLLSTESEYVAATNAGKKGHRLRFLLEEFKLLDAGKPTILRVDNKSAITVAVGLWLTGNLKHMERRYAWLQHVVRRRKFVLKYIPTTEQPADFLTKALHFPAFNWCSDTIGQVRLADVGDGDDDVQQ
ncbi:unnamed protein product [Closterium sp. NIES-53]